MAGLLEQYWPHLTKQESGNNPYAVSPKGAFGIAQLMPGTAADPGFGIRPFDPNKPGDNERMGKDYFAAMLARYGNDPVKALVAYNWGPGNADKWNGDPSKLPAETRNYVSNIRTAAVGQPMQLGQPDTGTNEMPQQNGGITPEQLQGLLGRADWRSSIGPALLNLGAGIAGGSTRGWGAGLGAGLAGAGNAVQNQQEMDRDSQMQRLMLGMKMAEMNRPETKNVKLPDGTEVTANISGGKASPLDTSSLGAGAAPSPFKIKDPEKRATIEGGARKEYVNASGDFIKVRDSYAKIQAASRDPSPAGDMGVIFNYMRLLDPGSTVREGEYATAANAGAVPDRIRNLYNSIMQGTKLAPEQRADFTKQAKGLFNAQHMQQKRLESQYRKIGERLGVDVDNVVPDLSLVEQELAAPTPDPVAAAPQPTPPSAPPAGVDPALWNVMTPQERALWQ
jgi:hypothetical protein